MLSEKMQEALNAQVNLEFFASYQYLAMAAYFESENLLGLANWMHIQSQEENGHAMKFYHYLNDALRHEQKVTAAINKLVDLAIAESDHATHSFLRWFVDEQVEEEANVDSVIQDLKRVGDSTQGLFMLDRELAQRRPEAEDEAEAD